MSIKYAITNHDGPIDDNVRRSKNEETLTALLKKTEKAITRIKLGEDAFSEINQATDTFEVIEMALEGIHQINRPKYEAEKERIVKEGLDCLTNLYSEYEDPNDKQALEMLRDYAIQVEIIGENQD